MIGIGIYVFFNYNILEEKTQGLRNFNVSFRDVCDNIWYSSC